MPSFFDNNKKTLPEGLDGGAVLEEATESAVADLLYDLGDKASFEEEEEEASFDSDSARASASNFLRLK